MEAAGLLGLADELLLKVMAGAGAPAVACAATTCHRLRSMQRQLAALPAFASAACTDEESLEECVAAAVREAREQLPAAADVCLLFVTARTTRRQKCHPSSHFVQMCQQLLPPGALVVGCCGRGLYGVEGGAAMELDPSQTQAKGASVLLGRMPGCTLRAFAASAPPTGGWGIEAATRAWLGLEGPTAGEPPASGQAPGGSGGPPVLHPLSCLLFAHPAAGGDVYECVEGLQEVFPGMLLTGGVASGMGELFCSQPLPGAARRGRASQPAASAPGSMGMLGAAQAAGQEVDLKCSDDLCEEEEPRYVGLLVCEPAGSGGDASSVGAAGGGARCGGLAAQGMEGAQPVLVRLSVIRNMGTLHHPAHEGDEGGEETELLGLAGAQAANGGDATRTLRRLASRQLELGVWAAQGADPGSFDAAVAAGRPAAVLQLYGVVEDAEALATANDNAALAAVLQASEQEGWMLCAQPLKLSSEGALRSLRAGVAALAAAQPPPHPLLPAPTCGLCVVSCTAKGRQMHKATAVEAAAIREASGKMPLAGVYCDGEIGPQILNAKSSLRWATTARTAGPAGTDQDGPGQQRSTLQGFTTIVTALYTA